MPLTATAEPNECNCDGSKATPYINSNLDCTAPKVWLEYKDARGDLNWSTNRQTFDNTPRGKGSCYLTSSLGKAELEVTMSRGCSNAYEVNLMLDKMGDCEDPTPREWLFLDGCILDVGASGIRGCFNLINDGTNNPISGLSERPMTFRPAAPCTACKCPVSKVVVATAGEVENVVNSMSVARAQSVSSAIMALKQSSLVTVDGVLGTILSDIVYVEVDDILVVQQFLGKTAENIRTDFSLIAGEHGFQIFTVQSGKRITGVAELKREGLRALLGELTSSMALRLGQI